MATKKKFLAKHGLEVNTLSGSTTTLVFPTADGTSGQVIETDGNGNLTFASAGGAGTFLTLSDSPSSFSGQANKVVKVNAAANAVEFGELVIGQSSRDSLTGDGTTTNFTLSSTYAGQNDILVFVEGVIQYPGSNFTLSGTTLAFTSAPANTARIEVYGTTPVPSTVTPGDGTVTSAKLAATAYTRDIFTGNGSTATYNLSSTPGSALGALVFIGGVIQDPTTHYTMNLGASPNTITFTSNLANGVEALVIYGPVNSVGTPSDGSITIQKLAGSVFSTDTFTGNGSSTGFTLSQAVINANHLIVTVAGVIQTPTSAYTVSGSTITFTSTPANGASIVVRYYGAAAYNVPTDNSVTSAKIVDGSITKTDLAFNPEDDAVALAIALG
tara:strand:- start:1181 stop:2335 length:1155 start_codon:yes stop_codon:yes gene_type:complete